MYVKTYQAKSTSEALAQIRKDLGPEAVILHVKESRRPGIKGILGEKVVLVTAAADEPATFRRAARAEQYAPGPSRVKRPVEAARFRRESAEELLAVLRENDIDEEIARRIAAAARRVHGEGGPRLSLRESARLGIERLLTIGDPICMWPDRPRVIALTGPTGVGKTTTTAKLAIRFCSEIGPRVAVIRAGESARRMPVAEELKDLPVESAEDPSELRRCVDKHRDKLLIIIDTAGRGHLDVSGLGRLSELLSSVPEAEAALTVSATTKAADLVEIADAFSIFDPKRLVLTKIDETRRLGSVLGLCARRSLPLTYVTTGPRIPDDIEPANARRLSRFILPN